MDAKVYENSATLRGTANFQGDVQARAATEGPAAASRSCVGHLSLSDLLVYAASDLFLEDPSQLVFC